MKQVVLFKSYENSSLYKDSLKAIGYQSVFVPVLEFSFTNLDQLFVKLEDHEKYSGLVITSQRTVDAINLCVNGFDHILGSWKNKPIFTVGETTGKMISSKLKLSCSEFQPGNADLLAAHIIDQNNEARFSKPLFFPCGNFKSETLPSKLTENNIELVCLDVYTTQIHHSLVDVIEKLNKGSGIPKNLVFFSPSGVGFVLPILQDLDFNFDDAKIIAIGPSTRKKIVDFGLKVSAEAKQPCASALCECLERLSENS